MTKSPFSTIENREDFSNIFDDVFRKTYKDLKKFQKFEYGYSLPKSYIIEYNPGLDGNETKKDIRKKLREDLKKIKNKSNLFIRNTEDPTLTHVSSGTYGDFLIDSFDSRFLFFHTLEKSNKSKKFFRNLVNNNYAFDHAWFTIEFLSWLAEKGNLVEGWHANFESLEEDSEDPTFVHEKESVSINKANAWEQYQKLKDGDIFSYLPLSALKVKRISDKKDIARVRIHSNGQLTGRGTSFREYWNIVLDVRSRYKELVEGLEETFSMQLTKGDKKGFGIEGSPFNIKFSKPIDNFGFVLDKMFSCTQPFRLLGNPRKIKDDYFQINAIDLHVGSKITFEMSPSFVRIYLPKGTCGNTVVRVIRSLQHKVDPNLEIDRKLNFSKS